MKIRIGLVGLPNVGKSSLFNAIAQQSIAQSENYPFCTIEPNMAPLAVPDDSLSALASMEQQQQHLRKAVPATMEWVDVAGLCKGASRGEGLGNRFLGTVRDCNAICHVLRLFEDPNTIHVDGRVDPLTDAQVVNLELLLADIDHVQRRLERTTCRGVERDVLEQVLEGLLAGTPARNVGLDEAQEFAIKSMGLLTLKPTLYCFNVDEVDFTLDRAETFSRAKDILQAIPEHEKSKTNEELKFGLVSAKLESELADKSAKEQIEFLASLGVRGTEETIKDLFSHNVLPRQICNLLGLEMAYTGPGVPLERSSTTKAHMFRSGSLTADGLASRLHGDIHKGFIRAEVVPATTLLEYPTYTAAKEAGVVRGEGRDYVLQGNDVVLIKWKPTK